MVDLTISKLIVIVEVKLDSVIQLIPDTASLIFLEIASCIHEAFP